jgi:hypothetical protein
VFDQLSIEAERQELAKLETDVKRQYVNALVFYAVCFGHSVSCAFVSAWFGSMAESKLW